MSIAVKKEYVSLKYVRDSPENVWMVLGAKQQRDLNCFEFLTVRPPLFTVTRRYDVLERTFDTPLILIRFVKPSFSGNDTRDMKNVSEDDAVLRSTNERLYDVTIRICITSVTQNSSTPEPPLFPPVLIQMPPLRCPSSSSPPTLPEETYRSLSDGIDTFHDFLRYLRVNTN